MLIEADLKEILRDDPWTDMFPQKPGDPQRVRDQYDSTPEPAAPGIDVSLEPFCAADIDEVLGSVNGEHDGPDWVVCLRLKDGRHIVARYGYDYTFDYGGVSVCNTLDEAIRFGMSDSERSRLQAQLPEEPS